MESISVMVLTCSTRPGALGPAVTEWLVGAIAPRAEELGVRLVPVALADLDLPFLDEEAHPSSGSYHEEHTREWSRLVASADGFIVVLPEYNYGMPATLKNALDYLSNEWSWKAMGFVSYGNTSAGTRAVQHAKQVTTTLRLVPLGATVAIRIGESVRDGALTPDGSRDRAALALIDELTFLTRVLVPARRRKAPDTIPGPIPETHLSPLSGAHAPDVVVLQRCCWVDEALANDTLELTPLREAEDEVRGWLSGWSAWGLWQHARLVGMVRARRVGDDWHIGRLATAPDLRHRGLGRWLLRHAVEAAPRECRRAQVVTGAGSAANGALYRCEGFAMAEQPTEGEVRMVRDLGVER